MTHDEAVKTLKEHGLEYVANDAWHTELRHGNHTTCILKETYEWTILQQVEALNSQRVAAALEYLALRSCP